MVKYMTDNIAISVKNLDVGYENNLIINDMNLDIPKGKISIIIGANGCGKSTLLKSMGRMIKPTGGEIYINDISIKKYKDKDLAKTMAILPQSPKCPDSITVKELVGFGRYPYQSAMCGMSKEDNSIVEDAIEKTELIEYKNRGVSTLSGGQRQRAWIAMTLAQNTDIILLDEPTTYLDMAYQLEVLTLLKKLNEENGTTIVMVLHELNLACKFADNIIGLKKGSVICQGRPADVITEECLRAIYGIDACLIKSENDYPICIDFN